MTRIIKALFYRFDCATYQQEESAGHWLRELVLELQAMPRPGYGEYCDARR